MKDMNVDDVLLRMRKIYAVETNKKLGELLGLKESSISNWKSRGIPSDMLFRVVSEKGVSLDWLVYGKEVSKELDPLEQLALIAFNRLNNEEKINALTLMNMGGVKLGAIQDTPTNNTISQHATNNGRNHLSISK